MTRLDRKIALVTGGGMGVGASCSRLLAANGAHVLVADINREAGSSTVEQINGTGGQASFVELDVSLEGSWQSAMAFCDDRHGHLDILVNNAGIYLLGSTAETTLEDWERTFAVNARGVFLGSKAAIPLMKKAGGGSIVNMSSNFGIVGCVDSAAYVASKGAVRMLTKATAAEVAKFGIRVNSVHPSLLATPMTQNVMADPVIRKRLVGPTLLERPGTPEEVAAAILFLASDESSFITGAEIPVDGGYTAV